MTVSDCLTMQMADATTVLQTTSHIVSSNQMLYNDRDHFSTTLMVGSYGQ